MANKFSKFEIFDLQQKANLPAQQPSSHKHLNMNKQIEFKLVYTIVNLIH